MNRVSSDGVLVGGFVEVLLLYLPFCFLPMPLIYPIHCAVYLNILLGLCDFYCVRWP